MVYKCEACGQERVAGKYCQCDFDKLKLQIEETRAAFEYMGPQTQKGLTLPALAKGAGILLKQQELQNRELEADNQRRQFELAGKLVELDDAIRLVEAMQKIVTAAVEARKSGPLPLMLTLPVDEYLDKTEKRIHEVPIRMLLFCPVCDAQHIDEGEWATLPHRTHECQHCRHQWRPSHTSTVGVKDLGPKPAR